MEANGNIHTPGFSVINGVMTIDQVNVVKTANISGNAVTVPVGAVGSGADCGTSITVSTACKIFVTYTANFIAYNGSSCSMYVSAVCNGVSGPQTAISLGEGHSGAATAVAIFDVSAGTHYVSGTSSTGGGGGRNRGTTAVFAIACQR